MQQDQASTPPLADGLTGRGRHGSHPLRSGRNSDPADVIKWIDAGKKDPAAVEILYLAHWAYFTGRPVTWCPFDAASEPAARRYFLGSYGQFAAAPEADLLCGLRVPSGPAPRDPSEPAAEDEDDEYGDRGGMP